MGCSSCSNGEGGKPNGCNSNGGCTTGGCNRLNTYDWLAAMDIHDPQEFDVVEISFKHGSHKEFYRNQPHLNAITGDMAVVDTGNGYDIGRISLTGELVRLQMKKKKVKEDTLFNQVIRKANERDLERLEEARLLEKTTLVRARVISRTLGLEMKIGDVEYQGDKRKATFYYTADGRIDFRELIRHFAKEFRIKIEMRQIGARQESARIGGIGSCGRELCCSTWLSDFKSVSTAAARYQNLAINQSKLSGQCGRLKCCLNYELDSYMDALERFPKNVDKLKTEAGNAVLIKTDIFKGIMYYAYDTGNGRGKFYPLSVDRVKEIQALNKQGKMPPDLNALSMFADEEENFDFGDVTGAVELPPETRNKKRRKSNNRKSRSDNRNKGRNNRGDKPTTNKKNEDPRSKQKTEEKKGDPKNKKRKKTWNKNKNKGRNNKPNNPPQK